VTDGWNSEPVSAEVNPPVVGLGQGLVVRAPGYLAREQRYEFEPIALWPADPAYVRELVYDWEFDDGSFRMLRWEQPSFTLTLEGALANDDAIRTRARQVLDEIQRRTGLEGSIGPGGEVVIEVDSSVADQQAVALARLQSQGPVITGGTISFVDREEIVGRYGASYSNTFLHEMGHIIGLAHSPDTGDVMTPAGGSGTSGNQFRLNEAIALHMMYVHREAGNYHPDRAPQLGAASGVSLRRTVIVD
jgi:hypothetical protein